MLLNTPIKISKNAPGPHVLDQLAAYLDYELPEDQRAVVREHLRRCPQCENELATLRATKQLLRDLPDLAPPRSFRLSPEQVAAANKQGTLAALPLGRDRLPRLVLALRGSAVCVFVLLLLLVGTDLTNRPNAAMLTASYAPTANTGIASDSQANQAQLRAQPAAAPTSTTAAAAAVPADTAAPAAAAASQPNAIPQPTVAAALLAPETTPVAGGAAGGARSSAGGAPLNTEAAGTPAPALGSAGPDQVPTAVAQAPVPPLAAKQAPSEGTFSAQSSPVNPTRALSAPAANPPLLQWLPWEVALGLLTLVLAGASLFVARNR